jgi:hypothetical protein
MTTIDPRSLDSMSLLFPCGHANPSGHRFCDTCGAARQRRCSACGGLNREAARFCGACGAALGADAGRVVANAVPPAEATASPPAARAENQGPSVFDDDAEFDEMSPAPGASGRWRREPLSVPTMSELDGVERRAGRRGRRWALALLGIAIVLAAAAVAVLGGHVSLARGDWLLGPILRLFSMHEGAAPESRAGPPASVAGNVASAGNPDVRRLSGPSKTPAPSPDTASPPPAPSQSPPAPTLPSPVTSQTAPARAEHAEPAPVALPARQAPRSAPSDEEPGPGTPGTSEEKMAAYLVDEFGPARAEQTARSNAAWYTAGRAEHSYWERVLEEIRKHEGS